MSEKKASSVIDPQPGVVYADRNGSEYSRPEPVVLLSAQRFHLYEKRGRLRIEPASVARRGATRGGLMVLRADLDQPFDLDDGDADALLAVHARVGGDVVNLGKYGEPVVKRYLSESFWVMGHLRARPRYDDTVRPEILAAPYNDPVYDWDAANEAWAETRARKKAADAEAARIHKETDRQAERARAWATLHGLTDIIHGRNRAHTVRSLYSNEVVLRTDVLAALLAAAGAPDLAVKED